jgi:tetratricopeptide (TPR) repeat protein
MTNIPEQQTVTIEQALDLARQHHGAGRLPEAEGIYQQILSADPNQPIALHLLGVIAHQVGKNDIAVDLIGKSLAIMPDYAEAHNNLGNALKDLGRLDDAMASYNKALANRADFALAHCNLGNAFKDQGRLDDAIVSYHRAVAINPDYAEAHSNLGNVLQKRGQVEEAAASYRNVLAVRPDYVEAHSNLGTVLQELGQYDEAIASFREALVIKPDAAEVHYNLGLAYMSLEKLDDAVASYRKAFAIKPDYAEAHYNLANALKEQGQLDQAVACYREALAVVPDYADAHNNLGVALFEQGKLDDAAACHCRAIAINPNDAKAHNNLGNALKELRRLDEAIASYRQALATAPDNAEAHNNLGNAFQALGRVDEALTSYRQALALVPDYADAHMNLSLVLLLQGKLKEGWEEYEWRSKTTKSGTPILPIERWQGTSLQGKSILVYAEQGLGDELMFASCIPDLMEQSPDKLFLECAPRLEALFARSFPGVDVCGKTKTFDLSWLGENAPPDYALPIGSLPKFFRNRIEDFPERGAYLTPSPDLVEKWMQRLADLGEGLKIGVSWNHGSNIQKTSIPLREWLPLLSMNASFINLQYGDGSEEIAALGDVQIHDWPDNDPLKDLDNQAALISCLDLVISVDNTTNHMSGPLGTPTWVLIEQVPDWRWPEVFGDCPPLYRSVRLFRQKQLFEWGDVIDRVARSLGDLIGNRS